MTQTHKAWTVISAGNVCLVEPLGMVKEKADRLALQLGGTAMPLRGLSVPYTPGPGQVWIYDHARAILVKQ